MHKYVKFNCLCGKENKVLMVGNNNADGKSKCKCNRNITIHLRRAEKNHGTDRTDGRSAQTSRD